jgi:hypothetical protein
LPGGPRDGADAKLPRDAVLTRRQAIELLWQALGTR